MEPRQTAMFYMPNLKFGRPFTYGKGAQKTVTIVGNEV